MTDKKKKTKRKGKKKKGRSEDDSNELEHNPFLNTIEFTNQTNNTSVEENNVYKSNDSEFDNVKRENFEDDGSPNNKSNKPGTRPKKGLSNGEFRPNECNSRYSHSARNRHEELNRNKSNNPHYDSSIRSSRPSSKRYENSYQNDHNFDATSNKLNNHKDTRFGSSVRHYSNYEVEKKHVEPVVKEVVGDLFTAGEEFSLVHCVAEDFRMGAGIAVQFKKEFGRVAELMDQRKKVGEVAFLQKGNRYIYYLVTKRLSYMKPTLSSMHNSIKYLRRLCEEHNVKKLAMPLIGCGLDKLNWEDVKFILNVEFQQANIDIVAYHYKEVRSKKVSKGNHSRYMVDKFDCNVSHPIKPNISYEYRTIQGSSTRKSTRKKDNRKSKSIKRHSEETDDANYDTRQRDSSITSRDGKRQKK